MSFKSKLKYRKAYKKIQDEDYNNAIKYFKKSFDDYSDDLSFLYNFAYCYYQIKDYGNYIEIINKLIYLDDSYEDAFNLKAGCFVYLGKFCEALNCLKDFLEKYDGSPSLLNHKNEIEMMCEMSKKGGIQINIVE
ncbi:MAG: hypothetical protein IJF83_09080 [Methanobrevibacter sp.]|nr:hypothetical protein [Methanobrevibacter sp.]